MGSNAAIMSVEFDYEVSYVVQNKKVVLEIHTYIKNIYQGMK